MSHQYQTYRCPNCQSELGEPRARCPHCGLALQRSPEATAFTRVPILDGLLGTISGLVLIGTGIGIIGAIVVYFQLRKRYPYFCTGIALSGVLLLLLLLGIFLICLGMGRG
jgi:hypothetical protein